jgi:predicted ribosome quality control (RQC) complex YloA/Tae2 family protein
VNGNSPTNTSPAREPTSRLEEARGALLLKVERESVRLARRAKAVTGDLAKGAAAEADAAHATRFVSQAARAPRGTTRLVAEDWTSGEAVTCELLLDPAKRPKEQVDAIFAEARRMKRGSVIAHARLEETHAKWARLAVFREVVSTAATESDLAAACDALRREDPALLPGLAPKDPRRAPRKGAPVRVPFRQFLSTTGARILVGRGATDNDELTLHVARPYDLWLHVKGEAGAHVVVPLVRGHDAPADLLIDAALLAAHFSDARGEASVDVTYVARRYVRKRRGSPPGQVQVEREKTLALRVDTARLATLLGREEEGGAAPVRH